jgi:PKD repeat protein
LRHVALARRRIRQDLPANRRPGISPGRRFALALGLALALLGSAGAASADSGSAPMVTATIYASGGGTSSESVSSSQLLADPQHCPAYSQTQMDQHSASGTTSTGLPQEHGSGTGTWSVATILGCLQPQVSPSDVTGITILNSDGSPQASQGSQLTPPDLATPSDFQPNTDSPVVSNLGSSFQYNRPWRGQSDDFNANDQVTSTDPISIEVFEGPPLAVSATASPSTVAAGSSLSFSAQVSGNQGSALTYDWSFGDNLPDSSQASSAVTYTDAGSYTVRLEVTDTNGGGGGTTVPITVTGSSGATPPPATASTPETSTGPAGTGANPNGDTHGTTGGNGKGNGKQPSNGNGNHNGKPSQDQTGAPSPSSSHHQKPSGSGTGPTGGSGGSSGGSGAGGSGSPSATTPSSSTPQPHPASGGHPAGHGAPTHTRPSSTTAKSGQLVTGRLVADVTPLSAGASPLVQRSPGSAAAAPQRPRPSTSSPLAVIGGGLAIVLLLGLGAGRELLGPGWWRTLRFSS